MKTKHFLAPLAMCCAVAALVGCASTNRQVSEYSFDESIPQRDGEPSSTGLSQRVFLGERAFRKLDLNADGTVTLGEWEHFDKTAGAEENFSALDENGDGQISVTEFLSQAPKYSKPSYVFGDPDPASENYSLSDSEDFQQQGWQLFSFHF
jgi:hypothetical protein